MSKILDYLKKKSITIDLADCTEYPKREAMMDAVVKFAAENKASLEFVDDPDSLVVILDGTRYLVKPERWRGVFMASLTTV